MYGGSPLTERDELALSVVREVIEQQYSLCSARGIRYIILFAPTKFRVYRDLVELEPGSILSDWVTNQLPLRLRDMVQDVSQEISFVDLTPDLVASARRGELPFFANDSHWSPTGHRVAAIALSAAISELP